MLKQKYDYQPLSRTSEDGRRLYQTPDGSRVPSVTTVLEKTKPEDVIAQGLNDRVTEFWGVEIPVYFPGIYAGTTDGAGIHQGAESILDYKQTNRPKKREWIGDYFLQLAAYALAHNEVHGSTIRKGVILMCVRPEQDAQLNIVSVPQYQEFILEGAEFDHYANEWWKRLELYYLTS